MCEEGRKFRLYQILGNSVTYLCGVRDLSGLFSCTRKEEKQKEHLWRNAFGEIERYDYLLTLALKAEYGDRVVPTEDLNNKITVEFSFQPIDQLVEISEDLQITTFGETVYQGRSDKIISEVPLSALFDVNIDSEFKAEHQMNISAYAIGLFNTQATYSEDYDALILTTLNDLSVTRITGMLPLYDKPVHKH